MAVIEPLQRAQAPELEDYFAVWDERMGYLPNALMEAGFEARLVNPAKVVQYQGLKRTDDRYDAFHLAPLLRRGRRRQHLSETAGA